ncbi:MAG: response regulator transcription factor [Chloroflexi bacterium]|nr:DNA-binding response regulator [Chloroflexota bacterium]NOG74942.1 response regulator transcription factor [Chloroflexota bacterium]
MSPLKTLVVDDHALFRQGLISLMNTRPDLVQVIGEASSGAIAVRLAGQLRPDLALLDIYMPEGDGLQTAREIRKISPETAVVILTSSEQDEHLCEAFRLGVSGYLLKNLQASELFELLAGVTRGEPVITRAMAARLLKQAFHAPAVTHPHIDELTEREVEVLRLVAQGESNPQIAELLCITVNTVKTHLKNILSKLQLQNRTQVAAYAVQNGLISHTEG